MCDGSRRDLGHLKNLAWLGSIPKKDIAINWQYVL
jgi:hypothetical protein